HTRWPRDWSSDVCSSDLRTLVPHPPADGAADGPADGLLDLAGNDYLGLLRRPDVIAGAVAAAQAYGGGAGASRLVTGTLALREEIGRASCRERAERSGGA